MRDLTGFTLTSSKERRSNRTLIENQKEMGTKMLRRIVIATFALGLIAAFATLAQADTYKLVNNTGHGLKIQSKAIKFVQPAQEKPAFFEMGKDEKSKTVDFGNEFRLWFLHIYNKDNMDNMAQNFYWDKQPQPNDPNKSWTFTVSIKNDQMEVQVSQN